MLNQITLNKFMEEIEQQKEFIFHNLYLSNFIKFIGILSQF